MDVARQRRRHCYAVDVSTGAEDVELRLLRAAVNSPERQLAGFISKFSPDVARIARAARSRVRKLLPAAFELVYDNYNALALAYGPSVRTSEVVLSLALYPRWVSLFFARGATLPDPAGILRGSGNQMRHVVLGGAEDLDGEPLRALIEAAVATHPKAFGSGRGRTVIKAVSSKQRPRRPSKPRGRPGRRSLAARA